jgi:hypothetical protein
MHSTRLPQLILIASVFGARASASIFLGSADSYAVFGAAAVNSAGSTVLNGNLGVSPGSSVTGFPPGVVNGTLHAADSQAQQAGADALTAFVALGGESPIQNLTGSDLGGLTLGPGVRSFDTSAQLTGTLTLDGGGNSAGRFDILVGSTLTASVGSSIVLINGAQPDNVFWRIGSSATIGAGSLFSGTVLAGQSITLNTGTEVTGRLFALNGTTTLNNNVVSVPASVPEVESLAPIAVLCLAAGILRRRARCVAKG